MISDELAKAAAAIEHHQREFPNIYSDLNPHISDLLRRMSVLRAYLDDPNAATPPPSVHDFYGQKKWVKVAPGSNTAPRTP